MLIHTVVVDGPLALRVRRLDAARDRGTGRQVMTLPLLAARLAGGFARPARGPDLDRAIRVPCDDSVTRVVKVVGFVASVPGFNGQPGVVNGASELFGEVFGDAGSHARSAVGVAELPLDAPVEVELIVEVA